MAEKRPALGRGLSALIPDAPAAPAAAERALEVDIDLLRPNQFQPRTHMDDGRHRGARRDRSARTASSSRSSCARPTTGYEIVAGERRWRASQRAGLLKVPVVVRDIPDDKLLAAALIENIQRENLNPIEEAHAYRRLADEFALTQEQIAESVGKDRSSIANYVRLLQLPTEIRDHVGAGTLSMGHARALAWPARRGGAAAPRTDVVAKALSVRETEALVKRTVAPPRRPAGRTEGRPHPRRRRDASLRPRHPRPHRPQGQGRTPRDRLRRRERAASHLRAADGEELRSTPNLRATDSQREARGPS